MDASGKRSSAAGYHCFAIPPLLVQLLFWYFAAWNGLPQAFRDAVNADHSWSILPGDVWWFKPVIFMLCRGGWVVFTSAFLIEEVESGLRSVPVGQREAALAQGFSAVGRVSLHPAAAGAG